MSKAFFDVFPQLNLKGHTKDLMAETTVLPGVELRAPAEVGKNMYETH